MGKTGHSDRRRQYAALPWRIGTDGALEILLITSRETRRWIIPKGWPMKGKKAYQAAAQEAFEEAGVQGDIATEPLGAFRYLKTLGPKQQQVCSVNVFALEVTRELGLWPEQHQRSRRWMPAREAARSVDEPELRALIEAFEALGG